MEDLKNLEVFIQTAHCGSFTGAAAQLGIGTPAVSKIISRLERELETRLFTRSTRHLSLTAEGRIFLQKATLALAHMDDAIDALKEARHEASGTVRLWSSLAIGKDHVLPMLADFLQLHPKLAIEVRLDDHAPDLITAGYDLALQHTAAGGENNVMKRLAELPLALVASTSYLAKHGVPRHPEDLAAHQCIATRSAAGHPSEWEFRQQRTGRRRETRVVIKPAGRVTIVEQYEAVLNAALCGFGLTVLFAHSLPRYLESGELQVVLPDWSVRGNANTESNIVYLRYAHRSYVPYKIRVLVDYLTIRFQEPSRIEFDFHRWAAK